jgi:aminoglycoside/choline kinase family phosphotransferase
MEDRLSRFLTKRGFSPTVIPLTPDASTREYYRLQNDGISSVACLYPEPFEDGGLHPYVDVTRLFESGGVRVPRILEIDGPLGIILLEDVGDSILREVLAGVDGKERAGLLNKAIGIIADIQATTISASNSNSIASRLAFDFEKLDWELNFFRQHYFGSLRDDSSALDEDAVTEMTEVARRLSERVVTITHRDFHAANIMVAGDGELVVIDHQDARMGTISYDIVSLLLDRIDQVPEDEYLFEMIRRFLDERSRRNLPQVEFGEFLIEFKLQSIQRCLKAIGTFSYQTAVRGKAGYTKYIPPMLEVVIRSAESLDQYPHLCRVLRRELEYHTR